MVWQRNDDQYGVSRKITRIPRTIRLAAVGLDQLAMNYSARSHTDGILDEHELEEVLAQPELIDALVKVERWHRAGHDCARCVQPAENSIVIHDFLVYNPDSGSVATETEQKSLGGRQGNHVRWHVQRGKRVAGCDWCAIGERSDDRVGTDVGSESPVPVPVPNYLNDINHPPNSGSVSDARDSESDQKMMGRLRREALVEAQRLGIKNLSDVRDWLEQASGQALDMGQAVLLAADVLRRSKRDVDDADAYVIGACRKTPGRVAGYADGLDLGRAS